MVKKSIFFENLDGLRFFSFLLVFLLHSTHSEPFLQEESFIYKEVICKITESGNLGVNFFFVLSGFLITYLLIEEKLNFNKIHIKNFYIRRVLRIWPLYFLIVAIGYILYIPFRQYFLHQTTDIPPVKYFIFFLSNFHMVDYGPSDVGIVNVLWSIAVEEQFYLFWPLLFAFMPTKYYKHSVISIIILSLVSRFYFNEPRFIEYHTISCIGDMAVGGLGALLILDKNSFVKKWFIQMPRYLIILLYCITACLILFRGTYFELVWIKPFRPLEKSLIAFVFLSIILEQNYSTKSLFKLSNFKKISFAGQRTYGLYVLHSILIVLFTAITRKVYLQTHLSLWILMVIDIVGAFFLSVIVANLSYDYFEKPFLKLKNKFGYIGK